MSAHSHLHTAAMSTDGVAHNPDGVVRQVQVQGVRTYLLLLTMLCLAFRILSLLASTKARYVSTCLTMMQLADHRRKKSTKRQAKQAHTDASDCACPVVHCQVSSRIVYRAC